MEIFVTGIGAVSAIGMNAEENFDSLRHKRHGMGRASLFRTTLDVPVAEVKCSNAELKAQLGIDEKRTVPRTSLLAMSAAKEAVSDAEIDVASMRVGLISSTSVGGMDLSEHFYEDFRLDNNKGRLRNVVAHDCGSTTDLVAEYLGIENFATTLSTACSSAGNAIMLGARMIRAGLLDCAVVGGADALCRFTLNGFNSLMILDREHCRPMDDSRNGLNLGEGAGFLVLQSEKNISRKLYCTLKGWGNANDAFHQTGVSPDGDGPFLAMSEALRVANVAPEEVDYINLHGTGTKSNDLSEGNALKRLFGERVPRFSSVKAFIGHALGASEGIEAVYSVLSVSRGAVFPNLNFRTPIPELGLVPETEFCENLPLRNVLSNAFGFGGNDVSLLFSKLEK